jgi:hypothetical protein
MEHRISPPNLAAATVVARRPGAAQLSWIRIWPVAHRPPFARRQRIVRDVVAPIGQLLLRLPDPTVLTPLVADIERILDRLASSGAPMPNNPVLGELAGRGRSSASRALERLFKMRRIRIESRPGQRRIVLRDGRATGWGDARPGHAPYCSNRKGETPRPPQRAPNSPPMPPAVRAAPVVAGPAPTCQWPMWAHGVAPNDTYCGQPSMAGRSWCPLHHRACFGDDRWSEPRIPQTRYAHPVDRTYADRM